MVAIGIRIKQYFFHGEAQVKKLHEEFDMDNRIGYKISDVPIERPIAIITLKEKKFTCPGTVVVLMVLMFMLIILALVL